MPLENVIIIGGGMGGLCLAQRLKQLSIPFTLYERDESLTSRAVGSCLGIQETAPDNLKLALPPHLHPDLEAIWPRDPLGKSFDFASAKTGQTIARNKFLPNGMYITSRAQLRRVLSTDLPIQYGKKFESYTLIENDTKVQVKFADGTTATGDILIGADGSNSTIRSLLLPNITPIEAGFTTIAATTHISFTLRDQIWGTNSDLTRAALLIGHSGTCMYISWWNEGPDADVPSPDGTVKICWRLDYSGSSPPASLTDRKVMLEWARQQAREQVHQRFWPLVDETKEEDMWVGKKVKSMPDYEAWKTGRVTLLGDAAHCMTSYGGRGALQAFEDAIHLSSLLQEYHTSSNATPQLLSTKIAAYEKDMLERGFKSVHTSLRNTHLMHPDTKFGEWGRNLLMSTMGFFMGKR
ncbi:hypothetical protein HK097_002235 [Rhizophlyctis rosea]|uniref:FAD-binding domain-containing protein n=1 Tax=Rhizophlyctis rosea TaxID=64517 RepID=A0AAD5SB73_9FUNG|nr:hypothetical protein HK097_002235 [Rhizophlyctis rosea]